MRIFLLFPALALLPPLAAEPWARHVIDDSSRGADGVRLADVNEDGLPDIATGWEEGGITRIYLHPGHARAREPWPRVTVGKTPAVEDAVFADVNADGALDVVACCEGREKAVHVLLSPVGGERMLLEASRWRKVTIRESEGAMRWMFALPLEIDGKPPVEVFAAGKGGAAIGWFDFDKGVANAKWHECGPVGWVMSIIAHDMDGDGDKDVFYTDRKESRRGCHWLENPGPAEAKTSKWKRHAAGGMGREVMFADISDLDGDGDSDFLVSTRKAEVLWLKTPGKGGGGLEEVRIPYPEGTGTAKAVAAGDLDGDGRKELVLTCGQAEGGRTGVVGLRGGEGTGGGGWVPFEIGGSEGVKFDRIELIDADGDGDLDVLTCEERANLGVIWYENPRIQD